MHCVETQRQIQRPAFCNSSRYLQLYPDVIFALDCGSYTTAAEHKPWHRPLHIIDRQRLWLTICAVAIAQITSATVGGSDGELLRQRLPPHPPPVPSVDFEITLYCMSHADTTAFR